MKFVKDVQKQLCQIMQKMANWLVFLLSIYSSCFLEAYDKKLQFLKP